MAQVLVLATMATKTAETEFLLARMAEAGVSAAVIDISLHSHGKVLDGDAKCLAMDAVAKKAASDVKDSVKTGAEVVVGIGGGTGGEIVLQIMRGMPITFPKVLCTTLPFDPRYAVADNSIIMVPTLADISALNGMLREALENTALIAAGLCRKERKGELIDIKKSVGITALGATEKAVRPLVEALAEQGRESTVLHSNGFGGAAFARFAEKDAFDAIIDLTPHELTRTQIAGAHAPMPNRFKAGGHLPRVVLPGALNFIGLGEKKLIPNRFLERAHYAHSHLFTHVKLTEDEMVLVATKLAESLNALTGACTVIVPMQGFSHQDYEGGEIEDPALREICLTTLQSSLKAKIRINPIDAHLFDAEVTATILDSLRQMEAKKDAS